VGGKSSSAGLTQSIASGTLTDNDFLSPPLYPARARGVHGPAGSANFFAHQRAAAAHPFVRALLRGYRVSRDLKGSRSRGGATPRSPLYRSAAGSLDSAIRRHFDPLDEQTKANFPAGLPGLGGRLGVSSLEFPDSR
jgi:hypothetical protein